MHSAGTSAGSGAGGGGGAGGKSNNKKKSSEQLEGYVDLVVSSCSVSSCAFNVTYNGPRLSEINRQYVNVEEDNMIQTISSLTHSRPDMQWNYKWILRL